MKEILCCPGASPRVACSAPSHPGHLPFTPSELRSSLIEHHVLSLSSTCQSSNAGLLPNLLKLHSLTSQSYKPKLFTEHFLSLQILSIPKNKSNRNVFHQRFLVFLPRGAPLDSSASVHNDKSNIHPTQIDAGVRSYAACAAT